MNTEEKIKVMKENKIFYIKSMIAIDNEICKITTLNNYEKFTELYEKKKEFATKIGNIDKEIYNLKGEF